MRLRRVMDALASGVTWALSAVIVAAVVLIGIPLVLFGVAVLAAAIIASVLICGILCLFTGGPYRDVRIIRVTPRQHAKETGR